APSPHSFPPRRASELLTDGDKIQLGRSTMLRFTYVDEHDESFQRQMFDSALRDGLTRAFNKRYFTERMRAEFHFAKRHDVPLSRSEEHTSELQSRENL